MTYEQALEYIHGISWTFCKPGLERISELCEKLGNPQKKLKFVHVAGTNGKGSFCSMLSSVLTSAGYRVGLYTSPYIVEFNERMQVSGRSISNAELAKITEYVKPLADAMQDKPTEFELITAIAFEYFKRENVDIVILEAGMGGRLDSTNVIEHSELSVITGIALDHTAFLGDTVEKIAAEKAGIIKERGTVLFGGVDDSAKAVIESCAAEKGAKLLLTDYGSLKIREYGLGGTDFDYKSHTGMHVNLLGTYQPRNAASVLEAVDALRQNGYAIPESAVIDGLSRAIWHARFEIISQDPLIIFDGAHNPEGIASAVSSIKEYFRGEKVYAVSGVLKDKDYETIASSLSEVVSRAFTITPDNPRALTAEEYAEILSEKGVIATASESIAQAVKTASREAKEAGKPLVCLGSLYTYSDVTKALNEKDG